MSIRGVVKGKRYQEQLWDLLIGFVASQALYAGVELGLFTRLSPGGLDLEELSRSLGIDPRITERVLTALVAAGLLVKEGERYRNREIAEACLVKGHPHYLGEMVSYYIANFYPAAGQLVEAARKGEPVIAHWQAFRSQEEIARASTLAMDNLSYGTGLLLAEALDLSPWQRLIDIGGGSGAIARALTERHPRLEAVVLDHPQVLGVARGLWEASPVRPRLQALPGDFLRDDLPSGFDGAILSNIIHGYGVGMNRRLMQKVFQCLNPRGQVVVVDFYLDRDKAGPLFPALFGIGASLLGKGAKTYSWAEVIDWLGEAGFVDSRYQRLTRLVGLVVGGKPRGGEGP